MLTLIYFPPKMCTFSVQAIDLGMLNKLLVEHNQFGYGAGWNLDRITIQEKEKSDDPYAFSCQQWLDSGIGDGKMKQELKLLGKIREKRLEVNVHGEKHFLKKSCFIFDIFFIIFSGCPETKNPKQI